MKDSFCFRKTQMDESLKPQLSQALKYLTEYQSREKCPGLWKVTDAMNEKTENHGKPAPDPKKTLGIGLIEWFLGIVLFVPAFLMPEDLIFAIPAGILVFAIGMLMLWKFHRSLLITINMIAGILLTLVSFLDPSRMGILKFPGIILVVITVMLYAKAPKKKNQGSVFDREADRLVTDRNHMPASEVNFAPDGLFIAKEPCLAYKKIDLILETKELFLPVLKGTILILQKKELQDKEMDDLKNFLSDQVKILTVTD